MEGLQANFAYPELKIDGKNLYEASVLFPLYGGNISETTALMQYTFQHYITDRTYPEIAETLLQIGITEMLHHEKLGEAIFELGASPLIGDGRNFWNGACVNYANDMKTFITADINSEKQAIAAYEKSILLINNKSIRALIERIIIDEELHLETLEKILNSL